jgi:class 3 adenylate cyclase
MVRSGKADQDNGILASFDGPGRAIRFAAHLQSDLRNLGIRIRTGIHTGEIEQRDSDVGGIAVHICTRIMGSADADEILVSRTVKDLTIGSSLDFRPRGAFTLKGVGGEWELYAVDVDPR